MRNKFANSEIFYVFAFSMWWIGTFPIVKFWFSMKWLH
jgi:hypothetical protein